MNLESLLISRDAALLGVLRPTLEKMSVNVDVCTEKRSGNDILAKRKFDAVIIDCDDLQDGVTMLHELRATQSNAKSVAFAVLNGKTSTQQAFQFGANFVLQKPLTPLHATRCFHAALNFMLRERRRYFRCPLEMPVRLSIPRIGDVTASSTNLSEGGIAIRVPSQLQKDTTVGVSFTLPNKASFELKGQIAWTDATGHAGIQFIEVPQSSQYQLEKWLSERLQDDMPRALQGYASLH
ncbi:MAG TPA: PilZ domain-containing protein [Terriglobales bacterium]|nr:PilZ domain-containing protein [Terriglobales bacterium]